MRPEGREPRLLEHLERFLGPIVQGWVVDATGQKLPFQVARFDYQPMRDCVCYCTLGLSSHGMLNRRTGEKVRIELFMMLRTPPKPGMPAAILHQLGMRMLEAHDALLPGDVVGPAGPLWDASRLEALYVTSPVYLPDDFAAFHLENGERCHLAWLVPVTAAESHYVRSHGSGAFEQLLLEHDPDLLLLDRHDVAGLC